MKPVNLVTLSINVFVLANHHVQERFRWSREDLHVLRGCKCMSGNVVAAMARHLLTQEEAKSNAASR